MFAERLTELRKEKKKSRKEISEILTVSTKAYGYYERGERAPDYENLIRLANYFSVSLDFLLGRTNEKNTAEEIKEELLNNKNNDFSIDLYKKIIDNPQLIDLIKQFTNSNNSEILEDIIQMNKSWVNILNKKSKEGGN